MYVANDITREALGELYNTRSLSVDTETTGLDPKQHELKVVTIWNNDDNEGYYIRVTEDTKNLRELIQYYTGHVYMHYAMFDIRFIAQLGVYFQNVHCTKIAAKIFDPKREQGSQSLAPLLERHLRVNIKKDKNIQVGDWGIEPTPEMAQYAEDDVKYLDLLHLELWNKMNARQQGDLGTAEFMLNRISYQYLKYGELYGY